MDQFLISRTSDSLNKRSVVETGRGARYLQDCLFFTNMQILARAGACPPPSSPRLPQNKLWGLSAASCQVFDSSTDSLGHPCCCWRDLTLKLWFIYLLLLMEKHLLTIYLPVTKSYREKHIGGAQLNPAGGSCPQGPPRITFKMSLWVLGEQGTNPRGAERSWTNSWVRAKFLRE